MQRCKLSKQLVREKWEVFESKKKKKKLEHLPTDKVIFMSSNSEIHKQEGIKPFIFFGYKRC